jgi:multidrug efflux system membrane fusion protein
MTRYRLLVVPVAALIAVGCSRRGAPPPPRVPVSVARAERRAVPFEVTATGTVEALRTVDVTSQVSGMLLRVRFNEGDDVAPGQVLFEIDSRPYAAALQAAQANLSRDLVNADNAARDAERYRTLASNQTVTQEDYQQKQAAADAAAATLRADSAALELARLNLDYATIRAPIGGRAGSLQIHEGNLVHAGGGAALVQLNQLRPILVRFAIPATNLPDLRRRPGPLQVLARAARDSGPALEGELSFIDNHVDTATGTVLLKARFPNKDGALWPGEFADVRLILGVQTDATVIPSQAVMNGQDGTYVFVITDEGTAQQRPVAVARTVDTLAVIARGVDPGTMVVTDGQLRLTPNAKVDIRGGPSSEGDPATTANGRP